MFISHKHKTYALAYTFKAGGYRFKFASAYISRL